MKQNRPRLVIAGTASGTGKTTITMGILAALKHQGKIVQPFKIGPDYIDPDFHKKAAGRTSYNLDSWLIPEEKLPQMLVEQASDADISIIEGVMGLYDGENSKVSSTASIAKALKAPVLLVLNCKSSGESIAAVVLGFLQYDPEVNIVGVILNNLGSENHARIIEQALSKFDVKIVGKIFRNEQIALKERHLGLTYEEDKSAEEKITKIREMVEKSVDLNLLVELANKAEELEVAEDLQIKKQYSIKLGIAYDEAFSFYYQTNLNLFDKLGIEIVKFSPLKDESLPDVDGLILGGGYPELYAKELSENKSMLLSIQKADKSKMPIFAECGGFMYLTKTIEDFSNIKYEMVGVITGNCKMQAKLQRFGYVLATALKNNLLLKKGEQLKGHEFHFSTFEPDDKEGFSWAFNFEKVSSKESYIAGFAKENILASYLHINFLGSLSSLENFAQKCAEYKEMRASEI